MAFREAFSESLLSPMADLDMRVSEMISGSSATVAIKLMGDDLAVLETKAKQIESLVRGIDGTIDASRTPLRGQMYLSVRMKHQQLSRLGISVDVLNQLVDQAVAGVQATEIIEGNRRLPVMVRYPENLRNSPEALSQLRLKMRSGENISLPAIAKIMEEDGPVQLEREDGKRQVVIEANVQGRNVVGFVNDIRRTVATQMDLPSGYFVRHDGQFANQARATQRLARVVPISLFLIFMILLSTFNSVRQALLILSHRGECQNPLIRFPGASLRIGHHMQPLAIGFPVE